MASGTVAFRTVVPKPGSKDDDDDDRIQDVYETPSISRPRLSLAYVSRQQNSNHSSSPRHRNRLRRSSRRRRRRRSLRSLCRRSLCRRSLCHRSRCCHNQRRRGPHRRRHLLRATRKAKLTRATTFSNRQTRIWRNSTRRARSNPDKLFLLKRLGCLSVL